MKQLPIIFLFTISIFLQTNPSGQSPAGTGVEDIQAFTLENGMKIIVLEDHSIPNASLPVLSNLIS